MKNYYEILQIKNFATNEEIKKSFRMLAIKYHPDKNKGRKDFEEKFKEIANAYEVLTDSIKKGDFDLRLSRQNLNKKATEPTTRTNYSEPNRPTYTEGKKVEKKEEGFKNSIFWIVAIVIFIIYLLSNSNSDNKTTTGNTKADKELEKRENAKKPKTGEIDFKK
ncbi:MAG: DnaJ domain-containing protein [Bacteroidetes bacterium]|nr:DnaJ domain-containing protein [Bacteroidota bacterium]